MGADLHPTGQAGESGKPDTGAPDDRVSAASSVCRQQPTLRCGQRASSISSHVSYDANFGSHRVTCACISSRSVYFFTYSKINKKIKKNNK